MQGLATLTLLDYNESTFLEGFIVKLSVIMPVYNEIDTIAEILWRVRVAPLEVEVGYGLDDHMVVTLDREIVVVDDGSTDGTREVLRAQKESPGAASDMVVLLHEQNQGKGAAVRTGLKHASGDVMLIQDADLEYDPREYPVLLRPIIERRAQAVYGSRLSGGPTRAMFFWHRAGNRLLTLVTNILYDSTLSDMETCYKVFTREVAEKLDLKAPGWGFDPEITAQILKMGYRIYEVPISYTGREFEEGKKVSWRDAFTVLWTLFKCRFAG